MLVLLLFKTHYFFDNLRQHKMLNDLFISRDVIGYLKLYVDKQGISDPTYLSRLDYYQSRQFMSYEQWWRLLEDLQDITDITALGIDIGKEIKAENVGVLGYLFKTSQTLNEALNCFMRFQRLIYAGSLAHVIELPNNETLIEWNPVDGYSAQTSDEILLAAMINIVREMLSPAKIELELIEVNFTQPLSKERIVKCENFFHCPVNALQQKLSIKIQTNSIYSPIPHSDTILHSILGLQAEELLKNLPDSDMFLANLRDIIIRSLHKGKSDSKYIAKQLNISERTLHRKLKSKGRVFREILQDIRKSLVVNYLADSKLTLAETALLLGYSEQSSFTRAFSKWYGMSPKSYIENNLKQ